jgi:hypothetical protein
MHPLKLSEINAKLNTATCFMRNLLFKVCTQRISNPDANDCFPFEVELNCAEKGFSGAGMAFGVNQVSFPDDRNRLSKTRELLRARIFVFLLILGQTSCSLRPAQSFNALNDRTIHLLISGALVQEADSPGNKQEWKKIDSWMQSRLMEHADEIFQLSPGSASIRSSKTGAELRTDPAIFEKIYRANKFMVKNNAVSKSLLSIDRIKRAILNPSAVSQISQLIDADKLNKFSETGGIFAIDPKIDNLTFLAIKSENQDWAEKLDAAQADPGEALAVLKSLKDDSPYAVERIERTIDKLSGVSGKEEKLEYIDHFSNCFFFTRATAISLARAGNTSACPNRICPGFISDCSMCIRPKTLHLRRTTRKAF